MTVLPNTNGWMRIAGLALAALFLAAGGTSGATTPGSPLIVERSLEGGFVLASSGAAPTIVYDPRDAKVVAHAASDLAGDIAVVAGATSRVATRPGAADRRVVLIGTLGQNRWIDRLVARRELDVGALRGAWESFLIAVVDKPSPGIDQALVIVGSDRRGAAFGAYELSEAIGVSPWSWWADIAPAKRTNLYVPAGARRFGPPSVRFRGIFINDEDWGLFPWAAKTVDPGRGNIGPQTYERVFELLLRSKANTLWPAMHKTSAPFNSDPANARLADEFAIVMGSSHAEPMLRNNVGEWTGKADDFSYASNPQAVAAYWETRVKSNAAYESLWTLGMRGIHDSGIVGAETTEGRIALLNGIIADQRAMLRKYVSPDLSKARQIFVPYKEVLELYRGGLNVPDDVTIVWPDDNHGYIRQFPSDQERTRSGGTGVYYHLSYLGAPLSYLWLSTTPPALVQEEMTRAYDRGARSLWIANVGDIKPAEINTGLFLEMAWDVERWRGKSQRVFLDDWARRAFGAASGAAVGGVLDQYYRLNFERRPEFLQWEGQSRKRHTSSFTPDEVDDRLKRFSDLVSASATAEAAMPATLSDAYFELVSYPVRASAAANWRFFAAERYNELIDTDPAMARSAGGAAVAADSEIKALTRRFNEEVAGGKWRHIMSEEPADPQWTQFRASPVALPNSSLVDDPGLFLARIASTTLLASPNVVEAEDGTADQWRLVEGLGRGRGVLIAQALGARLAIVFDAPADGAHGLDVGLLPLFPDSGGSELVFDVAMDGAAARTVRVPRNTGDAAWSQGVLDNLLRVRLADRLAPGRHELVLTARGSGIGVDQLLIGPSSRP